jgi:putative transposase
MPFLVLHVVLSFLLDLVHVLTRSNHDRAVELLLLRQQLRLYERQAKQPRPSRWEKVTLASLAAKLPNLSRVALVYTPATRLRWHREIVRRTWTFDNLPWLPCSSGSVADYLSLSGSTRGPDGHGSQNTHMPQLQARTRQVARTARTLRAAGWCPRPRRSASRHDAVTLAALTVGRSPGHEPVRYASGGSGPMSSSNSRCNSPSMRRASASASIPAGVAR